VRFHRAGNNRVILNDQDPVHRQIHSPINRVL
jgi:hypothetical protein